MSCPVELHFHHVGVFVSDLEHSVAWYEEILGFKLMYRVEIELPYIGNADMAFLKNGDMHMELYGSPHLDSFSMEHYLGELGTKHLCFWVDDDAFEKMRSYIVDEKKLTIIDDCCHPEEICGKPGGNKVLYFEDPDGIPIEIIDSYTPGEY